MKNKYVLILSVLVAMVLLADWANKPNHAQPQPKPTDIADGIRIGKQRWATKNLSTTVFENGEEIPRAATPEEWEKAGKEGTPAWCYYSNDATNNEQYGKLYNYYAVTDPRGLAPEGWHVATDADWNTLIDFLGGTEEAGRRMKNKSGWTENKLADNVCGFSAMPGGLRSATGQFSQMGAHNYMWSVTPGTTGKAHALKLFYNTASTSFTELDKECGVSIRCLIDLE